jgi:hypothetical protein
VYTSVPGNNNADPLLVDLINVKGNNTGTKDHGGNMPLWQSQEAFETVKPVDQMKSFQGKDPKQFIVKPSVPAGKKLKKDKEKKLPPEHNSHQAAPSTESGADTDNGEAVLTAKKIPIQDLIDIQSKIITTKRKGIGGLEITVTNNSKQYLRTVAIDVFYYKKDKGTIQKKTLYFSDLFPGKKLSLTAPGNKKATGTNYELGLISSESGLYVSH